LIVGTGDKPTVAQGDRLRRLEPRSQGGVGEFPPCFVEEALPSFFSRLLHPRLTKGGTSSKGGPKLRLACGKVNLDQRARDSVRFPASREECMGPTYRPRNRRRINKHGFRARLKDVWGREVLSRRLKRWG